jgi:hypothetical protein
VSTVEPGDVVFPASASTTASPPVGARRDTDAALEEGPPVRKTSAPTAPGDQGDGAGAAAAVGEQFGRAQDGGREGGEAGLVGGVVHRVSLARWGGVPFPRGSRAAQVTTRRPHRTLPAHRRPHPRLHRQPVRPPGRRQSAAHAHRVRPRHGRGSRTGTRRGCRYGRNHRSEPLCGRLQDRYALHVMRQSERRRSQRVRENTRSAPPSRLIARRADVQSVKRASRPIARPTYSGRPSCYK